MGLGPNVLALYRHLKILGAFDGLTDVVELGSQGVWCPDRKPILDLFGAFGRKPPPDDELMPYINSSGTGRASSRHLHERLDLRYECIDIDGNFGSITLDLNFDEVPANWKAKFGLTTNHGTTEHLLNQQNAFKVMHDLTKPGGLMLHAVPYSHVEHGFFNYQPNLFNALARYNGYQTVGIWMGIDWTLPYFIPWDDRVLDFLIMNSRSTHLLLVVQRKVYPSEFKVPIQGVYEPMIPRGPASRYELVIEGKTYKASDLSSVRTDPQQPVTLYDFPARQIVRHLARRIARRLRRV
jgi:SAM-dependent methyltransferase